MAVRKISFVIPVFNEAANIRPLYKELTTALAGLNYAFELIFVDDGSTDDSVAVISQLGNEDKRIFYIELSKNFGQQYALKAGMDVANGDCVITMDCDLQHPPDVVLQLIKKWEEGYEVVYTKRVMDHRLPWFKRKTSNLFYSILNILSDTRLESGVADFRLMNRNVIKAFIGLTESGLFLRGLVKWVGFRQYRVDYQSRDRHSGTSKYSFRKMATLAIQGLMSFTTRPLYFILYFGIFLFVVSMGIFITLAVEYWMTKVNSLLPLIAGIFIFFFSLQLIVMGIMSIYMSHIIKETRQRPLYIVRSSNYTAPPNV